MKYLKSYLKSFEGEFLDNLNKKAKEYQDKYGNTKIMKHLELFENFITDFFKNKENDALIKLSNFFVDFINKNIKTCTSEYKKQIDNNASIDIIIELYNVSLPYKIIRLYYYNDTIAFYFYPFPSNYNKELENLKDFFDFIFNTIKSTREIKVDEIKDVMNKITKENFDSFIDTKKYNL